jgi:signal transduction histidine kinase
MAIQPEVESDRRQKEFITNASHELKTPLAVIKADAEYLEILNGENEWTKAIMNQTDRMNGLIQNLVMISKCDEAEAEAITDVNVSKVISEIIEPFMGLAEREKKTVKMHVASNVIFRFEANQIRMLTSILVDNAIKYCDDEGTIEIYLSQKKPYKPVTFSISNTYAEGKDVDYSKFFERFFRQDESHTIEGKGGYGIGLSVAESICRKKELDPE